MYVKNDIVPYSGMAVMPNICMCWYIVLLQVRDTVDKAMSCQEVLKR